MQKYVAYVSLAVALAFVGNSALAVPQFQKAWFEIYLTDHEDEDYVKTVKKDVKCFVCHQGKSKKNRNPYGELFMGKLTKDDKADTDKIMEAINEVGDMHTDAEDEDSPTYAEVIAEGKLPGGELEEVKKEPSEE